MHAHPSSLRYPSVCCGWPMKMHSGAGVGGGGGGLMIIIIKFKLERWACGFSERSSALSQQIELAQLEIGEMILTCRKTFDCIKTKSTARPLLHSFK